MQEESEMAFCDSGFQYLPPELLEKIFSDPALLARDLFNLSVTCSACTEIINFNSLWRIKFKQRWPKLVHSIIKILSQHQKLEDLQWKSIYKHRLLVKLEVLSKLVDIGRANYMEEDRYQLAMNESAVYTFANAESEELAERAGSDSRIAHLFVVNELREVVKHGPQWQNLTRKFYADKCLHCLSHDDLRPQIEAVLTSNSNETDLEEGATLIAQWMQPQEDFALGDIKTQLDTLAEEVKAQLRLSCPTHPLFAIDGTTAPLSPSDSESLWGPAHCKDIIVAIEQVVKHCFNQNFGQYAHPRKSYINCVLEDRQAIPITLCLIIMGLASRLGVVLEPVSFPETFVLRWLEYPFKSGLSKYTFIDPFNGRYSVSSTDLPSRFSELGPDNQIHPHVMAAMACCSKQEVLSRMLRNLMNTWRQTMTHHEQRQTMLRFVVELECMVEPTNYHHAILMVQLLLQLEVNIQSAMAIIQEVVAVHPALTTALSDIPLRCESMLGDLRSKVGRPRASKVKRRKDYPQVKHAVGLIMQHRKYSYRCVISGWDSTCQAPERWIRQMGVDRLPNGRHQPFYHVWAADGSDRYAAQENLEIAPTPGPVSVSKVGRLFESYNGLFYVPNTYLAGDYPDDSEACTEQMESFIKDKPDTALSQWTWTQEKPSH
ncbi:F-box protein 21 [Plakobranchus ocellatus]|uniref:F-box protein 21 n=1 Tax=Plakobranchus ocellatus TaxID=259542 RepID=A0AAV3Z4P9_9GAST|nr:F-box protein 21 [Plakobranchus ocellatus]